MCIIIVKPAGVKLPTDDLLRVAAAANRDGCGFMTEDGVVYHSMYRELSLFLSVLHKCVSIDKACAIHFRYATHGSKSLKNCHPFSYKGEFLLMHNGVLPIESKHDKTDSEIFLNSIGRKLMKAGLTSPETARLLNDTGSRFAVCDVRRHYIGLFGDFQYFGGCAFSNLRPFYKGKLALTAGGRVNYVKNAPAPPPAPLSYFEDFRLPF